MRANSILLTTASAAVRLASASAAVASSLASSARSSSTRASSTTRIWASQVSTVDFRRACSFTTACALSLSFQNPGSADRASSSATFRFLPSTSKMPPESYKPTLELVGALSQGTDFHGGGE
jgi:hypothetical protein